VADQPWLTDRRAIGTADREVLVEGCRAAMGSSYEAYGRWLGEHEGDVLEVYRWARAHDPELYGALRRRRETQGALMQLAEARWGEAQAHPDPAAVALIVEAVLGETFPGRDPAIAQRIKEMIFAVEDKSVRAESYLALTDELRPAFAAVLDDQVLRPAWPYLLADTAQALFRAENPLAAVQLHQEAWLWVRHLPTGSMRTAKAVAHMVCTHVSAVGHVAKLHDDQETAPFDEMIVRLDWARELLLAHCPSADVANSLVGIGLAESQLRYFWRRAHNLPRLESEQMRLRALERAELDLYCALDLPFPLDGGFPPGVQLPQGLHASVTRMLIDLAGAAWALGEHERAQAAVQRALDLTDKPHHRLEAQLSIFTWTSHGESRERVLEEILRDVRSGALGKLSPGQRLNLTRRIAQAAEDLSRDLRRDKRHTAAWFWSAQAAQWREDDDSLEAAGRAPTPGRHPVETQERGEAQDAQETTATAAAGKSDPARRLVRLVGEQNTLAMVMTLRRIADGQTHPTPELIGGMQAVDAWHPQHRRARPGRLLPSECRDGQDVARAALELADEFAYAYVRYLHPRILIALAQLPQLADPVRRALAQEAYDAADKAARWRDALRAQELILHLAEDAGDAAGVRAAAEAIVGVVRQTLAQAAGAADLVDRALHLTGVSTRIAGSLAEHAWHAPAFDVAHAASGLLSRSFVEDPRLAEEFELVERHADHDPEALARLFDLICDRITHSGIQSAVAHIDPSAVTHGYGPSSAIVQLLAAPQQNTCWALGRTTRDGDTRDWSVDLGLTPATLRELRTEVWKDLHPNREKRPVPALGWLHERIVRPLLGELDGVHDVFIVPHGAFAGLPVHAARDENGHLIERHKVSYLPDLTPSRPAPTAARTALVGGWDPKIDAPREALDLAAHLKGLGYTVNRCGTAKQGRQYLLDPAGEWGVVHIAAHGDFYPWPVSMTSRLRLSNRVTIKAGDWLRGGCRASFGFINACTVGRHAPHAGDLNGFPLALRVRGAVSTISALSLLPSAPARAFARAFYASWPGSDSLRAYQAACVEAIRRGDPACYWAPYLHTGPAVRLSDPRPPQPSRSTRRNTPRYKAKAARRSR